MPFSSQEVRSRSNPGPKKIRASLEDFYTSHEPPCRLSSNHTHSRYSQVSSKQHESSKPKAHGKSTDSHMVKWLKWLAVNPPSQSGSLRSSHKYRDEKRKDKHHSSRHGARGSKISRSSKVSSEAEQPLLSHHEAEESSRNDEEEEEEEIDEDECFVCEADYEFLSAADKADQEAYCGVHSPCGDYIALFASDNVPLKNPFTGETIKGSSDYGFWRIDVPSDMQKAFDGVNGHSASKSSLHMSAMPEPLFNRVGNDHCSAAGSEASKLSSYLDPFTAKPPPLSPTYEFAETIVPSDSVTAVGERMAATMCRSSRVTRSDDGIPGGSVHPDDSVTYIGDERRAPRKDKKSSDAQSSKKHRNKH